MTKPPLIAAIVGCLACGCSEKNNVEKPAPPDMSGLLHAYAHPTADLSAQGAADVVAEQVLVAETMESLTAAFPEIEEAINQGLLSDGESSPFGSDDSEREPLRVTGSGYLEVTRICPGFDPDQGPDDANGSMRLTVGFTEQGVDPVVWGTLRACRFAVAGQELTLWGDLQVHVGENLQFDTFGEAPVLVRIAGEIDTGGVREGIDVDFRVLPDATTEYRLALGDGHVIYWERVTERGLRAANGNFSCDFEARRCSDDTGTSFDW